MVLYVLVWDGLINLGPDNLLPIVKIILYVKNDFWLLAAAIVQILLEIDRSHLCFGDYKFRLFGNRW